MRAAARASFARRERVRLRGAIVLGGHCAQATSTTSASPRSIEAAACHPAIPARLALMPFSADAPSNDDTMFARTRHRPGGSAGYA